MRKLLFLSALFFLLPEPAFAQNYQIYEVDCSGTVTAGGTAQNAIGAGAATHGFTIQNIDTTEPLGISFTGTAAIGSAGTFILPAGAATSYAGLGSFTTPLNFGTGATLSVVAATTGHKFSCARW